MVLESTYSKSENVETDTLSDGAQLSHSPSILRPASKKKMRGYFGIGIENGKTQANLGTLWRSANLYDAAFLFTINKRYDKQCSDTMASHRHVPLYNYANFDDFYGNLPYDCQLVGVELIETSIPLTTFCHPERAVYLLGAEDHGLSKGAMEKCHHIIQIPAVKEFSMNVAVAGSVVMYDRFTKLTSGPSPGT